MFWALPAEGSLSLYPATGEWTATGERSAEGWCAAPPGVVDLAHSSPRPGGTGPGLERGKGGNERFLEAEASCSN